MRNPSIDILRSIGLLMVILAHVSPCGFVYELRTFDVVLMVFVSGLTFSMKPDFNYLQYLKKRTSRLVIPTYIFLTGYFAIGWLLNGKMMPLSDIVLSYTLIGGIGYVWIIRIFLLIMVVAPLLYKVFGSMSIGKFLACMASLTVAADALTHFSGALPGPLKLLLEIVVIPTIGYSVPYSIAMRIKEQEYQRLIVISIIAMLCISLTVYWCSGSELLFHLYKTPPRSIYLMYGVLVSVSLYYYLSECKHLNISMLNRGGQWLGQNTIWIYFWHIPFVNWTLASFDSWVVRYIFLLAIAISLYYIQYRVTNRIGNKILIKYLQG